MVDIWIIYMVCIRRIYGYSLDMVGIPSGNDQQFAMEHGPVEIVSFQNKKDDGSFHSYVIVCYQCSATDPMA